MSDFLNQLEDDVLSFVQSNDLLSPLIKHAHTKYAVDLGDYAAQQLPAVSVYALGFDELEPGQAGRINVNIALEVIHCAGDITVADDAVKRIVGELVAQLHAEFVQNYDGDYRITEPVTGQVLLPEKTDNEFQVIGLINARIIIS